MAITSARKPSSVRVPSSVENSTSSHRLRASATLRAVASSTCALPMRSLCSRCSGLVEMNTCRRGFAACSIARIEASTATNPDSGSRKEIAADGIRRR